MPQKITRVDSGSPLRGQAEPGDRLISINGYAVLDVLDYKFHGYDPKVTVRLQKPDGSEAEFKINKPAGSELGLEFETYLMDSARSCANNCVFCFIDQLPKNMRPTLYFKDDDARLSFLTGNYITLTNLSEREIDRIIALRVSPVNISVHTTNPTLRVKMLQNKNAGRCLGVMSKLAAGGIAMNCQIVCCPGLNDGAELGRTMRDLYALYPSVNSVSVVPVGLTRHRHGLFELKPFDRTSARAAIAQVESFGDGCLQTVGARIFYASDELYLKAGLDIPPESYYDDFPQLENGVGMMRLFEEEFLYALESAGDLHRTPDTFTVVTGADAAGFIKNLLVTAGKKYGTITGGVLGVQNRFFGPDVTVSGLLTGGDIIDAIKGKALGERLLIPKNMLRREDSVFLDDVTVHEIEAAAGVPVIPVQTDGEAFFRIISGLDE